MKLLNTFVHATLQRLIWLLIKLLIKTYKLEVQGKENKEKARTIHPKGSFVFALWHEQVVSVMRGHAWSEPYLALASRSKDGDYAAFVAAKMGFVPVRGSSRKRNKDKGGREAMIEYIVKMRQGISGGITVDGPKGPRHVCKQGVAVIARETGAPILPVIGIASKFWEFNSRDRFKVPKPFSRIILKYGPPITVSPDADEEKIKEACEEVARTLLALEEQTTL